MNLRIASLTLAMGVAVVLGSAANADAFFGRLGVMGCCEPSCECEPSCGCEVECCDPCARPRCLLGGLRGMFSRNNCCEPTCGCEPSCGCEAECCDPCARPRCRLLSCLRGMFPRHNACCEPACGCEPSCCCGG